MQDARAIVRISFACCGLNEETSSMAIEITSRSLPGTEPAKIASDKTSGVGTPAELSVPLQSRLRRRILRVAPQLARRNFSSRAKLLSGGEVILLSAPKSGRTWIRTFLCAYLCRRYGLDFTLQPGRYNHPEFPRVVFSHDRFEHRTKGNLWDRLRGKYLVPKREVRRAKIILLVRDPRDCFVSLYVQMTRRDPSAADALKRKTVSELLRDKRFGILGFVRAMNDWLDEFASQKNFMIIRYEALRASPAEHFRELLAVLGQTTPDMSIFQEALEFSEFENMQKLEAAGAFDSKILRPGDVRDPESFKVRRGKVGGYREYLSTEDQEYASNALKELDVRFGY
jgi:sulfotransferase family protein